MQQFVRALSKRSALLTIGNKFGTKLPADYQKFAGASDSPSPGLRRRIGVRSQIFAVAFANRALTCLTWQCCGVFLSSVARGQ